MRVYLDNCALNRPFDSQMHLRIRLETEAKLAIQQRIHDGEFELVWSYIIDFENRANPFLERRDVVRRWRLKASLDMGESDEILRLASAMKVLGLKSKDSLHVACAIAGKCDYSVTTDDGILKRQDLVTGVHVRNPIDFVREVFNED